MSRLWEKGTAIDAEIYAFTLGEDPVLDVALIASDIVASIAHAMMLRRIEILSEEEEKALVSSLRSLLQQIPSRIAAELEDGHTWIEHRLVALLGEVGEKIHTGRSRNDQVLAASRLYAREYTIKICTDAVMLGRILARWARKTEQIAFPGRTHMQLAMPFTLGMVFAAWGEQLVDDLSQIETAYGLLNRSPLGSAAGYGVPLPLDRSYVSELLGFASVQNNVLAVQNSRGRVEAALLNALEQLSYSLAEMAGDLIFYSLPECGYLSLPTSLTTGSSIMPQKRNPDVLELIRGRASTVSGYAHRMRLLRAKLPTGYHRDLQETKEALLKGLSTTASCIRAMCVVVEALEVNNDALDAALDRPELFATDEVYKRVQKGQSFRAAYRDVASALEKVESLSTKSFLDVRNAQGMPGNPCFSYLTDALTRISEKMDREAAQHHKVISRLAGGRLSLTKS